MKGIIGLGIALSMCVGGLILTAYAVHENRKDEKDREKDREKRRREREEREMMEMERKVNKILEKELGGNAYVKFQRM